MKTKDCFYGQVRAVTETLNGTATTVVPPALNITKQEAITWDNATGMNPLWDKTTIPTQYMSYGEMLQTATLWGSSYALEHLEQDQSEEFYHERIREDYKNDYSMLCHTLAPLWMLHHTLAQPNILDYDYIVARQFDTWFNYPLHPVTQERIKFILSNEQGDYTHRVSPNKERNIPIIYAGNLKNTAKFPIVGNIASYFLILNREAVEILRHDFFRFGLEEMDLLYSQVGYSKFLRGNVGNVFCKIFIKNNIHVIDIEEFNLCFIKQDWSDDCKDFSRLERITGVSN